MPVHLNKVGLFGISFLLSLFATRAYGQNCTVNAGVDEFICKNQSFVLKGEVNGFFYSGGQAIWTQVGGPTVSLGNQEISGNSIRVNVNAFSQGQIYKFLISARCLDGSQISDSVVFTTQPSTIANAGTDLPQVCPGTKIMNANAPLAGFETGKWTKVSGPDVTIINASSPTTGVIFNAGSPGNTVLKWTIINVNGCATIVIPVVA